MPHIKYMEHILHNTYTPTCKKNIISPCHSLRIPHWLVVGSQGAFRVYRDAISKPKKKSSQQSLHGLRKTQLKLPAVSCPLASKVSASFRQHGCVNSPWGRLSGRGGVPPKMGEGREPSTRTPPPSGRMESYFGEGHPRGAGRGEGGGGRVRFLGAP